MAIDYLEGAKKLLATAAGISIIWVAHWCVEFKLILNASTNLLKYGESLH